MSCGLCKETVQRLAWLLQGAGRLSAEQVEAKFADVSVAQPTAVGAWIAVALRWEQVQTATTVVLAALLAEAVYRSTPLRPMSLARRRGAAGVPAESAPSREQIEAELHERSALALSSTDQWLSLSVEAQAVQVAAGESPARPFAQFRVEFRRGAEVVLAVAAVDGKAQLTLEHFRTAQQRQADHLVIIV